MTEEVNEVGSIQISPQAIASIAYQAVIQSYGVVGLASKNIIDGLSNMIVKDLIHGIDVHLVENHIVIDVYIIVQYGTRIKEVANSLANTVKFRGTDKRIWPMPTRS